MQLFINGKIHTMHQDEVCEAFAIQDGIITKTGTNNEILALQTTDSNLYDLQNQHVIPGFNDSHLHLLSSAQMFNMIDLTNARSIDDLIQIGKAQLDDALVSDQWLIGRGWNHDYFDVKAFPTREDLDQISCEYPICFIRACSHICTVNSKALDILNISKAKMPIIEGGQIYLDDLGNPNGLFSESALSLVYDAFSLPTIPEIKKLILLGANELVKKGVTSVQSDDFKCFSGVAYDDVITAYSELANDNLLKIRVYQQCLLPDLAQLKDFISKGHKTGNGNTFYRIGPIKLLLDGSLGARTALLQTDYADMPGNKGISVYTDLELQALMTFADESDCQLAVHGIGDGAIHRILDNYERLNHPAKRHGIIHCQITDERALKRFKATKTLAYVQPIFLHYDQHIVNERVGSSKANTSYAFKTMIDLNISMSLGTDSPVEPFNPFKNLFCAITRKDLNGTFEHGWLESECLTRKQAILAYTTESAYASFEENQKGKLLPGYFADFIVLKEDIFNVDLEQLKDMLPVMTVVNGQIVYTVSDDILAC